MIISLVGVLIVLFGLLSVFGAEEGKHIEDEHVGSYELATVPDGVMKYEDEIKSEMEEQDLDETFLPVLLAIASQESGGRVPDIFQSSESLGLPPNSIGAEESIKQGVKYVKQLADKVGIEEASDEKLNLVLQSYNFGEGFIDFAKKNGGYSEEVAQNFSNDMAEKMGWTKYGDPKYVSNVSKYLGSTATGAIEGEIVGNMAPPHRP